MNIVITSETKPGYLFIDSKGILESKQDLFDHARMIYKEFEKNKYQKILIDATETKLPLDILSYYDLAEFYLNDLPAEIRSLEIGVVISEEYESTSVFWETVCMNKGLHYHAFVSFQDAHKWLTG